MLKYKKAWTNTWRYVNELKRNYKLEVDGRRHPDIYSLTQDQYDLLNSIISKMASEIINTADERGQNDTEEIDG